MDNQKIKFLKPQQVQTFLNYCKKESLRDYVMFLLCYRYGMRRAEVHNLNLDNIDMGNRKIRITGVKNGKTCYYTLREDEYKILKKYLKDRDGIEIEDKKDKEALFISNKNNRISKEQLHKLFKKYRKKARITKNFTMHSLRHSIAMHTLNSKVSVANLDYIQKHLRHRDRRSTEVYAHLLDEVSDDIRGQVFRAGVVV